MRLAMRNLVRNRRATFVTSAIVAVAAWSMIVLWGFTDGSMNTVIRSQIELDTGDLQIHHAGYLNDPNLELAISDSQYESFVSALAQNSAIKSFSPRLKTEGLLQSAYGTKGVEIRGVEPGLETHVTILDQAIIEGHFLENAGEIVFGKKLADQLDVRLGEKVVLQAQGLVRTRSKGFRLVGVMNTGLALMDQSMTFITLDDALTLTDTQGPTEIALTLTSGSDAGHVQAQLQNQLGQNVEVVTFAMLNPMLFDMIRYSNAEMVIWMAILGLLAGFGVANTILFTVLQRTREFGIILALGLKPKQLARLVTVESLLTTFIGFALGAVIGLGINVYLEQVGFNLSAYSDAFPAIGMPQVLYSKADWLHVLYAFIIVILTALISARYPAKRATQLEPTEAMKII